MVDSWRVRPERTNHPTKVLITVFRFDGRKSAGGVERHSGFPGRSGFKQHFSVSGGLGCCQKRIQNLARDASALMIRTHCHSDDSTNAIRVFLQHATANNLPFDFGDHHDFLRIGFGEVF